MENGGRKWVSQNWKNNKQCFLNSLKRIEKHNSPDRKHRTRRRVFTRECVQYFERFDWCRLIQVPYVNLAFQVIVVADRDQMMIVRRKAHRTTEVTVIAAGKYVAWLRVEMADWRKIRINRLVNRPNFVLQKSWIKTKRNSLVLSDFLATLDAPQHAGRIVGNRCQAKVVRWPGDWRNSMSMSSKLADQLITIHSPNINNAVRPSGGQILAVRRNFNGIDLLAIHCERLNQATFVEQITYLYTAIVRRAD